MIALQKKAVKLFIIFLCLISFPLQALAAGRASAKPATQDSEPIENIEDLPEITPEIFITGGQQLEKLKHRYYMAYLNAARSSRNNGDYKQAISLYHSALTFEKNEKAQQELEEVKNSRSNKKNDALLKKIQKQISKLPDEVPKSWSKDQEYLLGSLQLDIKKLIQSDPDNLQFKKYWWLVQRHMDGDRYITLDIGSGQTMRLVKIPAGSFMMGSASDEKGHCTDESPARIVKISSPFYMGVHEVTNEQYNAVMSMLPLRHGEIRMPACNVSWNDAKYFCRKLSQITGKLIDLPTEAQWEYACRAGTTTAYNTGDKIDASMANFDGSTHVVNNWPDKNRKTSTYVMIFDQNQFGLDSMHGNLWEWCLDWYDEKYYYTRNNIDPQGPQTGQKKVLRGGTWKHDCLTCRSAKRNSMDPGYYSELSGFRVVIPVNPNSESLNRKELSEKKYASIIQIARAKFDAIPKKALARPNENTKELLRSIKKEVNQAEKIKPLDNEAIALLNKIDKPLNMLTIQLGYGVNMEFAKIPAGRCAITKKMNVKKVIAPATVTKEGYLTLKETKKVVEPYTYTVIVKKPFYIGIYEVTQEQYFAVMEYNPSHYNHASRKFPVECVSPRDAEMFCERLSSITGMNISLPTEAQWELAGRAKSSKKYSIGDSLEDLDHCAWLRDNSKGTTHPVGQKHPNRYGIYDTLGNVDEICYWSPETSSLKKSADETDVAIKKTPEFALRGGHLMSPIEICTYSGFDNRAREEGRCDQVTGFRVIISP